SQAPALRGTPDSGHRSSASASASWARSSARPTSPTMRATVATTCAPSIRQTASTVRRASAAASSAPRLIRYRGPSARSSPSPGTRSRRPPRSRLLVDPAHLHLAAGPERGALGPLHGLLLAGDLDEPEAVEQLVRLA